MDLTSTQALLARAASVTKNVKKSVSKKDKRANNQECQKKAFSKKDKKRK